MYEKHFHLRERPFALSPDPAYLYPSRVHQEALNYLRYGIEGQAGFVVITGDIGSGKTTMLQSLLSRLDRGTTVARIVNTLLEPRELLDAMMLDFGIDPTAMSKPVLLSRLQSFLVEQRQAARLTLLVIDEAQNLTMGALEEVRMLSNYETEKSKLLQIVMIGQPELRATLLQPRLEQLRQRITVSYHLQPLDADETANYINHRLKRAASGPPIVFPHEVTDLIHAKSRGLPRIINVIADQMLLSAYGMDRRSVDAAVAQDALTELYTTGVLASHRSRVAEVSPGWTPFVPPDICAPPPTAAPTVRLATVTPMAAASTPVTAMPIPEAHEAPTPAVAQAVSATPAPSPATRPAVQPGPAQVTAPAARTVFPPLPNRILSPVVLPNGVRVQRFGPFATGTPGIWGRIRRVLLGTFEAGA